MRSAGDNPIEASQDGKAVAAKADPDRARGNRHDGTGVAAAPAVSVSAEGRDLSFDISDIGPGITAITECVARHAARHRPRLPARSSREEGRRLPPCRTPARRRARETASNESEPRRRPDPIPCRPTRTTQVASLGDSGQMCAPKRRDTRRRSSSAPAIRTTSSLPRMRQISGGWCRRAKPRGSLAR